MPDTGLVEEMIRVLNKSTPGKKWDEIAGLLTLPSLKPSGKEYSINLSEGLSVKAFVNLSTGEIRLFPLEIFLKANNG
jgi:hypothetical protein